MSESRKAFEAWAKLAFPHMSLLKKGDTDKYVYKTANFACEAFCEGEAWQASRQALEGEPVGTAKRCGYDRDITYCEFEADEVPIGTKLYTHPASADKQAVSVPEWIKCSDRLPAEYDGDFEGLVWVNDRDMTLPKYAQSRVHWSRVRGIAGYTHWMPTGFRRPQPPKQEGE